MADKKSSPSSRTKVQNPASSNPKWTFTELHRQCHRLEFHNIRAGWEHEVLLTSDHHWDNTHCDRALLKRHLDEAMDKNAPVFSFGDTFCAMQGKWDPRRDQEQLRAEHRGNNYLDRLVKTAAEWYAPYSKVCKLWTPGNHEENILVRLETNLLDRMVDRLKDISPDVRVGSYWGFVKFRFDFGKTLEKSLCYHHGYGGGGEVTRGMIDNSRTRGQYDADIHYSGHIHRRNVDENVITGVAANGTIVKRSQLFFRGSTYKDENTGWHATKGRSARPLGGWWLKFTYRPTNEGHLIDMSYSPAN